MSSTGRKQTNARAPSSRRKTSSNNARTATKKAMEPFTTIEAIKVARHLTRPYSAYLPTPKKGDKLKVLWGHLARDYFPRFSGEALERAFNASSIGRHVPLVQPVLIEPHGARGAVQQAKIQTAVLRNALMRQASLKAAAQNAETLIKRAVSHPNEVTPEEEADARDLMLVADIIKEDVDRAKTQLHELEGQLPSTSPIRRLTAMMLTAPRSRSSSNHSRSSHRRSSSSKRASSRASSIHMATSPLQSRSHSRSASRRRSSGSSGRMSVASAPSSRRHSSNNGHNALYWRGEESNQIVTPRLSRWPSNESV